MHNFSQAASDLFGITLTEKQLTRFERYADMLIQWNNQYNLTAIREKDTILIKHFLDSLSCLAVIPESKSFCLIDVGTGAGFPGIPIKIALPNIRLTLVDSVGKKVNFCQHIIDTLALENTKVIQARAEELGQSADHRETYDWAVARAVSKLSTLSEYLLPLIKVGGTMLAQKGESGPFESHNAEKAIQLLGGHLRQLHQIMLPGVVEERYLILIDKIATTPPQYPRRTGQPSRNPL